MMDLVSGFCVECSFDYSVGGITEANTLHATRHGFQCLFKYVHTWKDGFLSPNEGKFVSLCESRGACFSL